MLEKSAAPIVFIDLADRPEMSSVLISRLGARKLDLERRLFPDGEHYVRLLGSVESCRAVVLIDLSRPDSSLLPLIFLSDLLREMGALSVILLAPYLAYMRQDIRFKPGEAISSRSFARLLSRHVDALVTVDPHLHRYHALSEIYSIPAQAVSAVGVIAAWIREHVENPLLIGPDAESAQWVDAVARQAGAPSQVLEKIRHGDRDVEVSMPELERFQQCTPILVDDIVSSGRTMLETLRHLQHLQLPPAVCIAVHGLFADDSYAQLKAAGIRALVSSNSVAHVSNALDVSELLLQGLEQLGQEMI